MSNTTLDKSYYNRIFPVQIVAAYAAFYACCTSDTWASEVGTSSSSKKKIIHKRIKSFQPPKSKDFTEQNIEELLSKKNTKISNHYIKTKKNY